MRTLRLLGVMCVALAGWLVTRAAGPWEAGLGIAAFLTGLGLVLFSARRPRTARPQKYLTGKILT
jgi:hypothetical protein